MAIGPGLEGWWPVDWFGQHSVTAFDHLIEPRFALQATVGHVPESAVTPQRQDGYMDQSHNIVTSDIPATDTLTIDCSTCSQQHTPTCDACMVTFICSRKPGDAVVVDLGEFRALKVLGDSGLVPPLRHSSST